MEKLLTIAIPTYKRPDFLDKCLSSIFSAIEMEDVDVLVMDDSTDQTNDAVCHKYKNLIHIKNAENFGIDKNICACIENSRTNYVWLIGEDDLMRRNAFEYAYNIIKENQYYPFIFANYSYITSDQKKICRDHSVDISEGEMRFVKFFENYLWSAGFIGGCIINRSDFMKTDYRKYIGTYYAHVAGICLAASKKSIFVINKPIVGNRVGDASTFTWSDDSFGVFQGWRTLLNELKHEFGTNSYLKSYRSHQNAHSYLGYKFLLNKKADGLLNDIAITALLASEISSDEAFRIRLVSKFMPRSFCWLLRAAYGLVRKQHMSDFLLNG